MSNDLSAVKLTGDCNRCGMCCFMGRYRCVNLLVEGKPGEPKATKCGAYSIRYNAMPIVMIDPEGEIVDAFCRHDDPNEGILIASRGFGKGCSMRWEDPEKWQISLTRTREESPRKRWQRQGSPRELGFMGFLRWIKTGIRSSVTFGR